ncbi:MAG: lysophospholipid acyltransferase family protein [Verrucomicrobiota bacterium]
MPRHRSTTAAQPPVAFKTLLYGSLAAFLIRMIGLTTRLKFHDHAGYYSGAHQGQYIIAFWHNRMVVMPLIFSRYYRRKGATVLTSASREGSLVERVVRSFGMDVVRGSSSRRGATALLALSDRMKAGYDVIVTPDGPRGPCYRLGPGIVFLSQRTGQPVMPIRVDYSRFIELKSWDRFRIPLPFSRIDVTLEPLFFAQPGESDEALEAERVRLEKAMQAD